MSMKMKDFKETLQVMIRWRGNNNVISQQNKGKSDELSNWRENKDAGSKCKSKNNWKEQILK